MFQDEEWRECLLESPAGTGLLEEVATEEQESWPCPADPGDDEDAAVGVTGLRADARRKHGSDDDLEDEEFEDEDTEFEEDEELDEDFDDEQFEDDEDLDDDLDEDLDEEDDDM